MGNAEVILKLQNQAAPQIAATVSAYQQLSTAEQKATQSAATYQKTQTQLALTDAKVAVEEQRLATQVANTARAETQAAAAALRLSQAQNNVAGGNSFAAQTAEAFTGQITAMVGPLAVATATIGALKGSLDLAQSSAKIDATRESFDNLARSVGTTGDLMLGKLHTAAQGTVSDANLIQAANSGLLLTQGRIAGDLPRILEIARAAAQATGDDVGFIFDSLVTGIARGSPKIIDNAKVTLDASAAFDTYAASIGKASNELTATEQQQATLNAVLAAGTQLIQNAGPAVDSNAAAFQRAGASLENFKNAFGSELAARIGPTLNVLNNVNDAWGRFITSAQGGAAAAQSAAAAQEAEAQALAAFDAELAKSGDTTKAEAAYQDALTRASYAAAVAIDEDRIAIGKLQIAAQKATPEIQKLTAAQLAQANATSLAEQRRGERSPGATPAAEAAEEDAKRAQNVYRRLGQPLRDQQAADAKRAADKAAQDAARLDDLRNQNRLINARTAAQKIAELERQKAATRDPIERQQLQNQIDQERNSAAKSHTSELNTQLKLNESTYDSIEKQRQAVIDLGVQQARNRLDTLKDQDELKKANAILNSSGASADLKARAQARKDLTLAEAAKRDFEQQQLQATAGGAIVNGKLYQSLPGGPLPAPPTSALSGGVGRAAGGQAAAATAGGGRPVTIVMDGKVVAEIILPYAWEHLDGAIQHARITQGA